MEMFKSKNKASLADLQAENERLATLVTDLSVKVEEAKTHTQSIADVTISVNELKAQIKTLMDEKAKLVETHNEEIKKVAEVKKEEVAQQAAMQVAAIGITQAELPPKVEPLSKEAQVNKLANEWNNASALEKEKIFNNNKTAILASAGISEERWNATFKQKGKK